jgi:hypothetical protein
VSAGRATAADVTHVYARDCGMDCALLSRSAAAPAGKRHSSRAPRYVRERTVAPV